MAFPGDSIHSHGFLYSLQVNNIYISVLPLKSLLSTRWMRATGQLLRGHSKHMFKMHLQISKCCSLLREIHMHLFKAYQGFINRRRGKYTHASKIWQIYLQSLWKAGDRAHEDSVFTIHKSTTTFLPSL